MNNLNYIFFDEFKKLDKICRDIYGASLDGKLGVTMYLDDMSSNSHLVKNHIPSWYSDYNKLKKLRNIRNELAHSQNSFSYIECTQDDIDFICNFRKRILDQTDPLSILHKQIKQKKFDTRNLDAEKKTSPHTVSNNNINYLETLYIVFLFVFILLLIMFAYYSI